MTGLVLMIERLRSSFWVPPAIGILLAAIAGVAVPAIDNAIGIPDALTIATAPDTARSVLQMIATISVSVAGVSFSVIVVALVLASQQLSPRVLRSFQRHVLNQIVLAVFLATAAFSLFVLGTVEDGEDKVPELSVTIAMSMAALSLGLFVVFLHHMVRSLNASAVIRRIAAEGHVAIEDPCPGPAGDSADDPRAEEAVAELIRRCESRDVVAPRAGYVASIEAEKLLAAADECDGFVEQRREIGEFVVTGGLLAVVWCPGDAVDHFGDRVNSAFVLNEERVVDDDIAFPLRQLGDIALKGLSPGINDPTTAENAMDSVTDTLVRLARQPELPLLRLGPSGNPRFRAKTPSLDLLVRRGFDQVRRDGASRPSFAVRLLELLSDLREAGGDRAAQCEEINRQARAILDQGADLADIEADANLVREAYERLHGRGSGRKGPSTPTA